MLKYWRLSLLVCTVGFLAGCGSNGGGGGGGPLATQLSLAGPGSSAAGFSFTFTVTARDASNTFVSNYSGTVHFTSSDPAVVLPNDSRLTNGTGTFSATLTNAGFQTITATDTSSSSIQGSLSLIAIAGEFSASSFGAKGDGQTDDTAAIQSAINAASAAGGGSVVLSIARYYTTGNLVIPAGVVLCGPMQGPFDIDPYVTAAAPTLLVTNTTGPFLTLQGVGSGVTDVMFHYPNQVHTSASAPIPYPYTILVAAPGTKVARLVATNPYDFLDIESGRVTVFDLFIGAYHNDIHIDHAHGHVMLHNFNISVTWDIWDSAPVPSLIDAWVTANSTAISVGRVDSLEISDIIVFTRFIGIALGDSSDLSQSPRCGYGTGSNIDLDTVQYGIIVSASNTPDISSLMWT